MWIFSGLSSPLISVIVFMSISNSFIALACNITWSQEVWCLLLCYSFSRLLWIFRTIFSFIKILRLFFLFLWKVPLAFWYRLHWNYGLPRWFSGKKICLPIQEMWVQSLGQQDLLEQEMTTCSIILAWKIPWTEEPGRLPSMRLQRFGHHWTCPHTLNL